jgi:hypothetical protein
MTKQQNNHKNNNKKTKQNQRDPILFLTTERVGFQSSHTLLHGKGERPRLRALLWVNVHANRLQAHCIGEREGCA